MLKKVFEINKKTLEKTSFFLFMERMRDQKERKF